MKIVMPKALQERRDFSRKKNKAKKRYVFQFVLCISESVSILFVRAFSTAVVFVK